MNTNGSDNHRIVRPEVPGEIVDAIGAMRSPVVISHVVPDADALGGMFGMARACASADCRPRVSLPEGSLSQRLTFLLEMAEVTVATPADFEHADGFVACDTAKQGRCLVGPALKETEWWAGRPVVNVDHHATNTQFGTLNWVVGGASSTCELVYYLLRAADKPVDAVTASLLYAGIQTDTLGFSLPTTNAAALAATAELVARGADVAQLGDRLCRSLRQSEFDLLRVIYANTRVMADGQIGYSSASNQEIHDAGCTAADIDDQIGVPRSLDGVRLAMLFTEGRLGKTRINFRGSGDVTVTDLAGEFKGGGHSQSAGAIVDAGLQETMDQVLPRAVEHLKRFGGKGSRDQGIQGSRDQEWIRPCHPGLET